MKVWFFVPLCRSHNPGIQKIIQKGGFRGILISIDNSKLAVRYWKFLLNRIHNKLSDRFAIYLPYAMDMPNCWHLFPDVLFCKQTFLLRKIIAARITPPGYAGLPDRKNSFC
jgi:hypothetical protein